MEKYSTHFKLNTMQFFVPFLSNHGEGEGDSTHLTVFCLLLKKTIVAGTLRRKYLENLVLQETYNLFDNVYRLLHFNNNYQ